LLRKDILCVVLPEGTSNNQSLRITQIGCIMTDVNNDSEFAQCLNVRGVSNIGSGDRNAVCEKKSGDTAHPGSTYSHHVYCP
jgi:hypothetical protein